MDEAAPDGSSHPCRSHWIPLTANQSTESLISAEPANNPATSSISGAEAVYPPFAPPTVFQIAGDAARVHAHGSLHQGKVVLD